MDGQQPFPLGLCEFLAYKTVLAYEKEDVVRLHVGQDNSYAFFDSKAKKGGRGDTQGYGFVQGDTAFIIMRGTASLMDWADDFMALPTTAPWPLVLKRTLKRIGDKEPRRHLGFARAWANVAPDIHEWLNGLPGKGCDVKHLCLSGHSLGGALAVIGAFELTRQKVGPPVAAVVTFAAPPAGGEQFRAMYKDFGLTSRTLRVESVEDAVPALPVYGPVGQQWLIRKRPMIGGWNRFWAGLLFIAGWTHKSGPATNVGATPKEQSAPKAETPPQSSTPSTAPEPKPADQSPESKSNNRNGLLVIGGLVLGVIIFLVGRRIIIRYRAHGVAHRYALYLTTLSYQQIRRHRLGDLSTAADADFALASADLDRHLTFIRGQEPEAKSAFASLRNYPLRVLNKKAAEKYIKETTNSGNPGETAPYALYTW